jgi:asparagine synthase (glutamine-hydrolysing)
MCGIAGRIGNAAGSLTLISSAIDSISHRGPDDKGFFVAPGVELGIARLAVIDVREGNQPKQDISGTINIVFNGEIYNHSEIRNVVFSHGGQIHGNSEAEAIVELYKIKGEAFVNFLRGMFAIAIWDSRTRELLIARDRVGEKPLLYGSDTHGNFIFASEMRALFSLGASKDVDERLIGEYLVLGYVNSPNTLINKIYSLPPAHLLKLKDYKVKILRYWKLPDLDKIKLDKKDSKKILSDAIEDAVKSQLTSERPLGTFLSGGIDSTIVTATACKYSKTKIKTFSIGFEDKKFNEAGFAKRVAGFLETDHQELIITPDPEFILLELGKTLDQPFADSSIIPTFLLNRFAGKEIVVALGGDGGDETMGGYKRYVAAPLLQKVNLLFKIGSPVLNRYRSLSNLKLSPKSIRLLEASMAYSSTFERYLSLTSLINRSECEEILHSDILKKQVNSQDLEKIWNELKNYSESEKCRIIDFYSYLPGDLLFKSDISSMANSLELRSPLLDYKYVEVAHKIADHHKYGSRGQGKLILREIAEDLVPASLIDRPKMGFAIPRASWLRGSLRELSYELLFGKKSQERNWMNVEELRKYWTMHQKGRNFDRIIWPVMMLELWARNWID